MSVRTVARRVSAYMRLNLWKRVYFRNPSTFVSSAASRKADTALSVLMPF